MAESRQYELVYVIAPTVGEEGVTDLHTQIEGIIVGGGGQIDKTDNWGRRRLAYEIGRHKEGTYVLELISVPAELLKELDRRLKVLDDVLRHLIVRVDEDLRKADQARSKRQKRQQRRRAAKGEVSGSDATSDVDPGGLSGSAETEGAAIQTEPVVRVEVQE